MRRFFIAFGYTTLTLLSCAISLFAIYMLGCIVRNVFNGLEPML